MAKRTQYFYNCLPSCLYLTTGIPHRISNPVNQKGLSLGFPKTLTTRGFQGSPTTFKINQTNGSFFAQPNTINLQFLQFLGYDN